jgi:glutamyl/glutaminyl-tRNA synthetase
VGRAGDLPARPARALPGQGAAARRPRRRLRGRGRDSLPHYNFASPVEDWLDGITHVIRGPDHISNTPKQIHVLRALGAEPPQYAHVPNINGPDGKKLSKRHGATSLDEFRHSGYLPDALANFLALLGWSYDDRTTIMSRSELIERFSLDRVQPSPATLDYQKLDWMNGVYIRALSPRSSRRRSSATCATRAMPGTRSSCAARGRSSRRRSSGSASSRTSRASSSRT